MITILLEEYTRNWQTLAIFREGPKIHPAILSIYIRKINWHMEVHYNMFITTKELKQPNPLSIRKYLNKPCLITKMEYYIQESVKKWHNYWWKNKWKKKRHNTYKNFFFLKICKIQFPPLWNKVVTWGYFSLNYTV